MSRFNRNDPNVQDDKFYLDDYRANLNDLEARLLQILKDFEVLPCRGEGLTLKYDAGTGEITITAGWGYDREGHRIVVPSDVNIIPTLSVGNNYVILRYRAVETNPRAAFYTGITYNTRIVDSYEIVTTDTLSATETGIVLGNLQYDGTNVVIDYSERSPLISRPPINDPDPPTVPTITTVATGFYTVGVGPFQQKQAYVDLSWTASTDTTGVKEYEVYWVPLDDYMNEMWDARVKFVAEGDATSMRLYPLPHGQRGKVKIRAVDNAGNRSDLYTHTDTVIAGVNTVSVPAPTLTLINTSGGVRIDVSYTAPAVGVFVWAAVDRTPDTSSASDLVGWGTGTTYSMYAPTGSTVYVVVRAYSEDEVLSDPVSDSITVSNGIPVA